jgi:hypothetical protein
MKLLTPHHLTVAGPVRSYVLQLTNAGNGPFDGKY